MKTSKIQKIIAASLLISSLTSLPIGNIIPIGGVRAEAATLKPDTLAPTSPTNNLLYVGVGDTIKGQVTITPGVEQIPPTSATLSVGTMFIVPADATNATLSFSCGGSGYMGYRINADVYENKADGSVVSVYNAILGVDQESDVAVAVSRRYTTGVLKPGCTYKLNVTASGNGEPAWTRSLALAYQKPIDQIISRVSKSQYRINGGSWIDYSGSIALEQTGDVKIESRTLDKAGNISVITTNTYNIIDYASIIKQIRDNIETIKSTNNVALKESTLEIANELPSSDVKQALIDELTGLTVKTETPVVIVTDTTAPSSPTINFDQSAKVISITAGTDVDTIGIASGVDKTQYKINGGEWIDYTGEVSLTGLTGDVTIDARTIDRAGNISNEASTTVAIKDTKLIQQVTDKLNQIEGLIPTLKNQPAIDSIRALVDEVNKIMQDVPAGADKDRLQGRIVQLIAQIDTAENTVKATESVKVAEEAVLTLTTEDETGSAQDKIDSAKELVESLPAGSVKDELQRRIEQAQDSVNKAQAKLDAHEAEALATKLVDNLTQESIDEAKKAYEKAISDLANIKDEALKNELTQQLEKANEMINKAQADLNERDAEVAGDKELISEVTKSIDENTEDICGLLENRDLSVNDNRLQKEDIEDLNLKLKDIRETTKELIDKAAEIKDTKEREGIQSKLDELQGVCKSVQKIVDGLSNNSKNTNGNEMGIKLTKGQSLPDINLMSQFGETIKSVIGEDNIRFVAIDITKGNISEAGDVDLHTKNYIKAYNKLDKDKSRVETTANKGTANAQGNALDKQARDEAVAGDAGLDAKDKYESGLYKFTAYNENGIVELYVKIQ